MDDVNVLSHLHELSTVNHCPTSHIIWASSQENLFSVVGEQQIRRPACASTQSDHAFVIRFL